MPNFIGILSQSQFLRNQRPAAGRPTTVPEEGSGRGAVRTALTPAAYLKFRKKQELPWCRVVQWGHQIRGVDPVGKRLLEITAGLALLQGLRLGGLWLLVYGAGRGRTADSLYQAAFLGLAAALLLAAGKRTGAEFGLLPRPAAPHGGQHLRKLTIPGFLGENQEKSLDFQEKSYIII